MKEIWKNIIGYEGLYQVSNYGRIKSLKRTINLKNNYSKRKNILKTFINHGYIQIGLCKNGKCVTKKVHRIVAEAFITNPYNKPCVNHIDGNKENNCVNNLEWCSYKENSIHYVKNFSKDRYSNIKSKKVYQYDINNTFIREWKSVQEIHKELNISKSSIYLCCLNKLNSAGGFIWKYYFIEATTSNFENWKNIDGYNNLYQVSNLGNVRSLRNGKNLKVRKNNRGYLMIGLTKDKKQKWFLIHKLVADTFMTNSNKNLHIHHIDGNKTNNRLENLTFK